MKIAYRNADLHIGNGERFLGTLVSLDERILGLYRDGESLPEVDLTVDLSGKCVIPGLVDIHTHGRAGGDFTAADSAKMREMAQSYLRSGVTALLPTLASAPFPDLCDAADRITALSANTDGARFLGVHLEGRYLNPQKRGAHAEELLFPLDPDEFLSLRSHFGEHFHVSCAPECDRDGAFLKAVQASGGSIGIAHTTATFEEAMTALERGAVIFTHTYNAMPPLHHREGGAVAAAMVSDAYAEIICDGMHVADEMIRLLYRCKGSERLVLITDSMEATGCGDGTYSIAGMTCIVKDGKALTTDGHLAGSTLSLIDGLFRLMRVCGLSLDEALPTATRNPALAVGLDGDVGTLETGKYADFIVLNAENDPRISGVFLGGKQVV